MAFKSGAEWKGNASGRPKKTEEQIKFERKCREWADLFALDNLKRVAKSKKASESLAAVREILDRGFGKSEAISYIEANVTAQTGSSVEEIEGELATLIPGAAPKSIGVDSADPVDAGK